MIRSHAALFDRLLAAVSEEYVREQKSRADPSSERRRAALIEGLLAGELLDTSALTYDFEASHLGAIAVGAGAADAIRDLAGEFDCRLLLVGRGEAVWAWFAARRPLDPADIETLLASRWPSQLRLALGEPVDGLTGWRLTHRQARAALAVALRGAESVVRYADVALLASMLQDDLLATSRPGLTPSSPDTSGIDSDAHDYPVPSGCLLTDLRSARERAFDSFRCSLSVSQTDKEHRSGGRVPVIPRAISARKKRSEIDSTTSRERPFELQQDSG